MRRIWRGWSVPVGGATPDRRKGERLSWFGSGTGREERRGDRVSHCERVGGTWRGWIVPVGGSTPDRHQARPAQLVRERHREGGNAEGIGCPIMSGRGGLGGGGSFRSGVQPPTGTRPERLSWFGSGIGGGVGGTPRGAGVPLWAEGGELAGVDRSGRGFNPRPAQGAIPDRHRVQSPTGAGCNPRPAQDRRRICADGGGLWFFEALGEAGA